MNIKKFLKKAMVGMVAAASIASPLVVSAEETIELKYWYCFADAIQANNEELTKRFNETVGKENNIHVTAETQGSYEDIYSKLQTAYVAGEGPDVSVIHSLGLTQFAKNGMLEPLTDVVKQEDLDDFYPGLLLNASYDDTLYGLPYLKSTPIMYYNKTMLDKVGIDPKELETFDGVLKASKAMHDELGATGFGFSTDQWTFDAFLRQSDSGILNEDVTQAIFANENSAKLFQFLRDGIKEEAFKFYQNGDDKYTGMANQQVGIWVGSTGSLKNMLKIAEDSDFELGTSFMPSLTGERNVPTGGANIVMLAGLPEEKKEAAALFINFMTAPEQAADSHLNTGYLPTRQSLKDNEKILKMQEEIPQYTTAINQLEFAGLEPNAPGYAEVATAVQDMITEIFTTDGDLNDIMQRYQDQSQSILDANK